MQRQVFIVVKEVNAVYSENHMEHVNMLYRQNAQFLCVKVVGIQS
jgi:hypothetical protein